MATAQVQARHVFHPATSGWDRVHAWQEATGEPVFVWGRQSGGEDGAWFGPVKAAFRKWLARTAAAGLTIYHDGVGADALGPLDPAPQKVLFLHTWTPRWERYFEWTIRCTGKVLVGQPGLAEHLHQTFAWIPEKYIQVIAQPPLLDTHSADGGTGRKPRTGIWLHGRPWRRHGNRLRAVADRWPAEAGQLEIIASGARRPGWARPERVVWSADLPLEFALMRLHTWDSTLLLNDFALDAPWLQRALELGCFPLVPDGASPARRGAWDADSAPSPYPWGDFAAALQLVTDWRAQRPQLQVDFDNWRQGLLSPAVPGNTKDSLARTKASSAGDFPTQASGDFITRWQAVKDTFVSQRSPQLRARKPAPAWYPVAWYERVQRLRTGV